MVQQMANKANGELHNIHSSILFLENKKLQTVIHINAHKEYLLHGVPPQGLVLKKNLSIVLKKERKERKIFSIFITQYKIVIIISLYN